MPFAACDVATTEVRYDDSTQWRLHGQRHEIAGLFNNEKVKHGCWILIAGDKFAVVLRSCREFGHATGTD